MTAHDKKQAVRLNIIQAMFFAMKDNEKPKTFRHNKLSDLEEKTFNFINAFRTEGFPIEDMRHATEIVEIINRELAARWGNDV